MLGLVHVDKLEIPGRQHLLLIWKPHDVRRLPVASVEADDLALGSFWQREGVPQKTNSATARKHGALKVALFPVDRGPLEEEFRDSAKDDSDLDPIRDQPAFEQLISD